MKSLQLTKPHLIVIVGIPGSGKTFFAEQFSKTFSAPFLNYVDLLALLQDDATTQTVWDYIFDQLCLTKQTLLIEGGGATRAERRDLTALARTKGYQTLYIWVQTEPVTAQMRATKNNGRALSENEFETAVKHFEPLVATEKYMVISGKHTYASQAKNVLKKLVSPRAEHVKAASPVVEPRSDQPDTQSSPRAGRITIN
jgi:predicted kinase